MSPLSVGLFLGGTFHLFSYISWPLLAAVLLLLLSRWNAAAVANIFHQRRKPAATNTMLLYLFSHTAEASQKELVWLVEQYFFSPFTLCICCAAAVFCLCIRSWIFLAGFLKKHSIAVEILVDSDILYNDFPQNFSHTRRKSSGDGDKKRWRKQNKNAAKNSTASNGDFRGYNNWLFIRFASICLHCTRYFLALPFGIYFNILLIIIARFLRTQTQIPTATRGERDWETNFLRSLRFSNVAATKTHDRLTGPEDRRQRLEPGSLFLQDARAQKPTSKPTCGQEIAVMKMASPAEPLRGGYWIVTPQSGLVGFSRRIKDRRRISKGAHTIHKIKSTTGPQLAREESYLSVYPLSERGPAITTHCFCGEPRLFWHVN